MPIDPAVVRRRTADLDREITRMVGAFEIQIVDVWGALRRRIITLTSQLQAERGRVVSTQVNLGIARSAARELEAALTEAGYRDLIAVALDEMGDLGKYQGPGQTRVARVERTAAWSAESLEAFRRLKLDELVQVPELLFRKVEQTILRGIVGAQDSAELVNELLADLDVTLPQARTIYDTALSEFSRIAVTSTATGADDEAFLYSGPIDGLTRPFCLDRVGRVFSRARIDEMDNGQLDNTLITGGGYNCRHTWVPVPGGDPLEDLADSGEFVDPVYAEEHAEAGAARERLKAAKRKARGN